MLIFLFLVQKLTTSNCISINLEYLWINPQKYWSLSIMVKDHPGRASGHFEQNSRSLYPSRNGTILDRKVVCNFRIHNCVYIRPVGDESSEVWRNELQLLEWVNADWFIAWEFRSELNVHNLGDVPKYRVQPSLYR